MSKLFRADIYRILQGKALFITLVVMLAINVLMIVSYHMMQTRRIDAITITIGNEAQLENQEQWEALIDELPAMNSVNVLNVLTQNMENMFFFLLPIIIVVAGAIFTHGTVKNDVSFGISRTQLYMSKLLLSMIISALFLVFYIASGVIIAAIVGGLGSPAPTGHWANFVQVIGAQYVLITAMICIGTFLAFTTKRTAAVNGAYIAIIFVPALVISILSVANPSLERLFDFNITSQVMNLSNIRYMQASEIATALGVGVFWILVTTLGGLALFKRTEIK
ncbi:MAG: ABC transporter permease [Defluviitaleaceae bacterium]|nr:ABC transporter permease [Defluviitaleaceae bacterium]